MLTNQPTNKERQEGSEGASKEDKKMVHSVAKGEATIKRLKIDEQKAEWGGYSYNNIED